MIKTVFLKISFFLSLLFLAAAAVPANAQVLDQIIAIVDEEIILLSELQQKAEMQRQQLKKAFTSQEEMMKFQMDVLDGMIADKILLIKARQDSLELKEDKIEESLAERMKLIREISGSEDDFKKELQKEGITEKEFKRKLRDDIEEQMLKEKAMMSIASQMKISHKDIEDFYKKNQSQFPAQPESVNISHLFMKLIPDTAKAAETINELSDQIISGADFYELAKEHSDDPTGKNGGKIGWFRKGDMGIKEFEDAAFALEPGEVSPPLLTRLGYHIIKLEEKEKERVNVSHILIGLKVTPKQIEETTQSMSSIREQVFNGMDFKEAVQEFSMDDSTKDKGGALGWRQLKDLPEEFINQIKILKPGELSKPILTTIAKVPIGVHLIRLDNRKKEKPLTLDQNYDLIKNYVRNEKMLKELEKLVTAMQEHVYVEKRLQ